MEMNEKGGGTTRNRFSATYEKQESVAKMTTSLPERWLSKIKDALFSKLSFLTFFMNYLAGE